MSNKSDDDYDRNIPLFSGAVNESYREWKLEVHLWFAETKEDSRPLLVPRLRRRGLRGQPKELCKTPMEPDGPGKIKIVQIEGIFKTLEKNGYGEEENERQFEVLGTYFDLAHGRAETVTDYAAREELAAVGLKKYAKIELPSKLRGYWVMGACRLHEAEKLNIRVLTRGEADLKDIKTAINKLIGRASREAIRDSKRDAEGRQRDRGEKSATSNFTVYSGDSEDERSDDYVTEQPAGSEAWYDELTLTEQEVLINLRDTREKLNDSVKKRGLWPPDKNDKRLDRRKRKVGAQAILRLTS